MKRIGYNSLAFFTTLALISLASSAMALTPTPNGIYAPDPAFVRMWNDYPQATSAIANTYPSSVVWNLDVPFALTGWANKGVWQLSGDGGVSKLIFPNLCNYSFEADFTIRGSNVDHAEGGLEISPWWNDDGGEFMANIGGEITMFGGIAPFYTFSGNYGIAYALGSTIHEKVQYMAGVAEPDVVYPAVFTYSIIYNGTPYSSGPLVCGPANPLDPPHGSYGQLEQTKLGGQVMGGPNTVANGHATGAGSLTGVFGNINFQNLDAAATPVAKTSWGSLKALYR